MRKNRFCTFTLIASLAIAAFPASLSAVAAGGATTSANAASLPENRSVTLTITPGTTDSYSPAGSSFTAYRVLAYSPGSGANAGTWTWSVANGFTEPVAGCFDADALGSYSAEKLQRIADALALQVDDTTMADKLEQKALTEGSCSWTTNNLGVYLVCETQTATGNFPSAPFLVSLPYTNGDNENSWNYSLTASPKGSKLNLEKVIDNAKGIYNNTVTYVGDKDTVANGDTVSYKITTKIPDYTQAFFADGKNPTFQLVDTMAKGLTLDVSSVTLSSGESTLTKDTDYTQTVAEGTGGVTVLTLNLSRSYLIDENHQNKELTLTCSATVNDNVSLADSGNQNTVVLNYSYDPNHPEDTKTVDDEATVYSFGIQVEKFDADAAGNSITRLAGAEFALFKESAKNCTPAQALAGTPYRSVEVTNADGIIDFKGLDAGTYYLKEVKAPDGYSLLMNPIKVEIIPDAAPANGGAEVIQSGSYTAKVNGVTVTSQGTEGESRILNAANREETVIVAVSNHTGFSLPLTGGRGIALILVISAAGLLAVTVLYVRGERKRNMADRLKS